MNVVTFCQEIDDNHKATVPVKKLAKQPEASNLEKPTGRFIFYYYYIYYNVLTRCTYVLTFAAATNSHTVGRTPGSTRVGRNSRKGVQAFIGKINSAVGRLNYAVLTGNFAGVYSGSRLIVERTDGTLEFVTDMSKMQQAKLTEQANALRVYYRALEGYLLRMPTEKYKKLMGNTKRMSMKLAVFNAVKMSERSMYRLIKDTLQLSAICQLRNYSKAFTWGRNKRVIQTNPSKGYKCVHSEAVAAASGMFF